MSMEVSIALGAVIAVISLLTGIGFIVSLLLGPVKNNQARLENSQARLEKELKSYVANTNKKLEEIKSISEKK